VVAAETVKESHREVGGRVMVVLSVVRSSSNSSNSNGSSNSS